MGLSLALHAAVLLMVAGALGPNAPRQAPAPAETVDPPIVLPDV